MMVLGIATLYYLLLILVLAVWGKKAHYPDRVFPALRVSVIIPVRNEQQTITHLLDDLKCQTSPPLEVIVVDDHSTDDTLQTVTTWMQHGAPLAVRIIRLSGAESGKKTAITKAVAHARGDVIVTTDGDCRVGERWLHSVSRCLASENIKLVAGAIRLETGSFFGEMQQLEQAALTGITAAFIALRRPVMCNGANLAYRKEVFNEVNGYEGNHHIASGDDEFLLRKIAGNYPRGVVFNSDAHSIITTRQAPSVSEFMNQRLRWAGKWHPGTPGISTVLALFVFVFHLTYISLPFLAMGWVLSVGMISMLVLIKLILEFICIARVTRWLTVRADIHAFMAWQFLYSPYVVFFGLASRVLKASWKGRKI